MDTVRPLWHTHRAPSAPATKNGPPGVGVAASDMLCDSVELPLTDNDALGNREGEGDADVDTLADTHALDDTEGEREPEVDADTDGDGEPVPPILRHMFVANHC